MNGAVAVSSWGVVLIPKSISSNSTASNQQLSCGTEDGCVQGRSIQGA